MSQENGDKVRLAVLAASVLPGFIVGGIINGGFLVEALLGQDGMDLNHPLDMISSGFCIWVFFTLAGAVVATPVAFFVGLPVHMFLEHRGKVGWLPYGALGLTTGVIVAITFVGIQDHDGWGWGDPKEFFDSLLVFALLGVVNTTAFWLMIRPDRTARRKIDKAS